jgi:hypothetical protein
MLRRSGRNKDINPLDNSASLAIIEQFQSIDTKVIDKCDRQCGIISEASDESDLSLPPGIADGFELDFEYIEAFSTASAVNNDIVCNYTYKLQHIDDSDGGVCDRPAYEGKHEEMSCCNYDADDENEE